MMKSIVLVVLLGVLFNMMTRWLRGDTGKAAVPRVETARKCPQCGAYRMAGDACGTPGCSNDG